MHVAICAGALDDFTRGAEFDDIERFDVKALQAVRVSVEQNTTPPLNNAALTGVPTTPTPSAGDNSTKIANTEFVFTAVAQGGGGVNIDGGTATSIRNTTTISLDGGGAI